MVLLHAFAGIFSLLLVVAIGYGLAWLGWFPEPCRKLLPKLVTNVSLPPYLGCTIVSSFRRDSLLQLLSGSLVPLLALASLFAIAWFLGRAMRVSPRRFGLFCASISNPNTIFIGIPVNIALFGQEALPFVLLYYFPSTFFFWTVGNYFISRDESQSQPRASAFAWQKIISPPMYGFLIGLAIVCANLPVPDFIYEAARITGEMTTPLALVFIGITLQGMDYAKLRINRDISVALAGRMLLSPLLMWALVSLFKLPRLMGDVFIIQSSLPVLMQVAILSAYYDTDPDYGSLMVCSSTILSIVIVPIYMALL